MFGFFKKMMRKEHLRLVSENRRMAAEIQRLASLSGKVMGDPEAAEMSKVMDGLISELDDLAIYLDRNDHLTPDVAEGMLEIYKNLSSQISDIQHGRDAARKLFDK